MGVQIALRLDTPAQPPSGDLVELRKRSSLAGTVLVIWRRVRYLLVSIFTLTTTKPLVSWQTEQHGEALERKQMRARRRDEATPFYIKEDTLPSPGKRNLPDVAVLLLPKVYAGVSIDFVYFTVHGRCFPKFPSLDHT